MYNRVPVFRTTLHSTLQLQQTPVAFYDCEKQTDTGVRNGKLYFKALSDSVFSGVYS